MQIQVHTDNHIEGHEGLAAHVKSVVEGALSHISDQITRVEIHLADENGAKTSKNDKRCMMEARITGLPPTAVTHHADSLHQAIEGAAERLQRSLEGIIDKRNDHR